jgi:hypothetical protein
MMSIAYLCGTWLSEQVVPAIGVAFDLPPD